MPALVGNLKQAARHEWGGERRRRPRPALFGHQTLEGALPLVLLLAPKILFFHAMPREVLPTRCEPIMFQVAERRAGQIYFDARSAKQGGYRESWSART